MFSLSQENVQKIVLKGYSVFITGGAGSGKSFFLQELINKLHKAGKSVCVAAPTGIASVIVGGTTIHSFAGIGTGNKDLHELISKVSGDNESKKRWEQCSILIIDEISMLSRELFEKLEKIARHCKRNRKPFGGIQLILSGDFFQLKPVVDTSIRDEEVYCFASSVWKDCIDASLFFNENFRQDEVELKMLLDDLRISELSTFTRDFMKMLSRPLPCDPLEIVRLYSHRDDVSSANDKCLELLPGEKSAYISKDIGEHLHLKNIPAPRNLVLKCNARVVLLKNINSILVNGLRGTVQKFIDGYPVVMFDNNQVQVIKEELFTAEKDGIIVATRKQIPLDLAYAMTIHKSQGMSFDYLEVDLSKVFEPGQAYVAVSRAKRIDGLRILSCKESLPKISALVNEFYASEVNFASNLVLDQFLNKEMRRDVVLYDISNFTTSVSIASTAKEPQLMIEDHDRVCELDTITMDRIHRKVQDDASISKDVTDILTKLQLKVDNNQKLYSASSFQIECFCKWLWIIFDSIYNTNSDGLVDRKKWTGNTKEYTTCIGLHSY